MTKEHSEDDQSGTVPKYSFQKKSLKKRKVRVWTEAEDNLLLALSKKLKFNWSKVSKGLQGRNPNQCLHRYRRLRGVKNGKGLWSKEEDEKVLQLVGQLGKNWMEISKHFKRKTGKQIRERFLNKLNPQIKCEAWTQEEDIKLIELYNRIGSHWNQISKEMPGRPQNKIKNRFYSHIKRFYQLDRGAPEEKVEPAQQSKEAPQKRIEPKFQPVEVQRVQVPQQLPNLTNRDSFQLFMRLGCEDLYPMDEPVMIHVTSFFLPQNSLELSRMDSIKSAQNFFANMPTLN